MTARLSVAVGEMLAHALALPGRPLLHVFASHRRYGGGWRNHGRAQEEALFRATDLPRLRPPPDAYPVDGEGGREGFVVSGERLDYAFVPAPPPSREASRWTLRQRAERLAELADGRDLVTGAWGCGVFRGDPAQVAREAARALLPRAASATFVLPDAASAATFARALELR